jgi:RND family efflux transporter MFP subunit
MKKLSFPLAALLALVVVIAAMVGGPGSKIEPGVLAVSPADRKTAITVIPASEPYSESVPASIEARDATVISSRLLARISTVQVRAGDLVEAGDVLLTLESADLDARLRQSEERLRAAEVRASEAERARQRADELFARALIAVADRDAVLAEAKAQSAELATAQQAVREAQAALAFTEIRSPISGRVVDRFAEPGDTAAPGQQLIAVYNPFTLQVEAHVRESLALSLQPGQVMGVVVPSLNARFDAKIEEIIPAADSGARSFLVRASLPADSQLLPGLYARLQVPAGERTRLLLPRDRVASVGQLDVVWVATDAGVSRRFVRLGPELADGTVEIIAGLEAGESVVPVPGPR